MIVAEAVGAALAGAGVKDAFGLLGSGNFLVTKAIVERGVRFTAARHESAAVSMADGYARVSGRPGVVTVHQGPGLTNAMTALTEAAKTRTPLLLLAADTSAGAARSNFAVDQAGLAAAVGAVAERARSPETALEDLARAWRTAVLDRRAVLFSMPLDVQGGETEEGPIPDPEVPGVAGAGPALEALGELAGALLATSANGHGLFAGSPWALGISGGFASPTGARLIREADVLVSFGASLNMWTTRHGQLVGPGTTVVQVDREAGELGAHRPIDVGVVGDARLTAEAVAEELRRRGHGARGRRTDEMAEEIAAGRWRDVPYEDGSRDGRLDPRTLSKALDEMLPPERIVAVDSGHFMGWPPMYLSVPDPAGFVFTQSFQSIGLGLSSAIGAAVARPDRLSVACLGDGGAMMAAGEFETLVRMSLPMLVVIYNDAAYGAEVHHFGPMGHEVDLVRYPDPDLAGMARGLGAGAETVRSLDDLSVLKTWLERRDGPLVLDVKVAPGVVAEWLEEAFRAH